MADLPGRRPELPLRILLLLALLLPGSGGLLQAQARAGEDPAPTDGVAAFVHGGLRLSSFAGEMGLMAGGALGLRLTGRLYVGGAGWILLEDSDLEGAGAFNRRTLGVGYGGAVVEVTLPKPSQRLGLAARTLVGAGNIDIRDPVTGIRINSSNFVVAEPEAVLSFGLSPRLTLEGSLSYRAVFGLDSLEGLDDSQVGGAGLSLLVRLGPLS